MYITYLPLVVIHCGLIVVHEVSRFVEYERNEQSRV